MPSPHKSHRLRTGRYSEKSRIYHITLATIDRQPVFHDWITARSLIDAFKQTEREGEASSLCWVVMPDHFHWLIELHIEDLP